MRAFLAIPLVPEEAGKLRALQESLTSLPALGEFRWTPVQNIHLTLRFLGDIGESQAARAGDVLEAAAARCRPFEMPLDRFGVFPHLRSPSVLWGGPERTPGPLADFAERLLEEMDAAGFPAEERPFRAHLTLARRRVKGRPPAGLEGELAAAEGRWLSPPPRFRMGEAGLFRSALRPGGAIYILIRRAPFS